MGGFNTGISGWKFICKIIKSCKQEVENMRTVIATIVFGVIIAAVVFFSLKKLFKVLKGEDSSCELCGKKGSCTKYNGKNK